MTNRELWTYHMEYQRGLSPGIAFLLKGRLQDFYKEYAIRINTINDKLKIIENKYFEHDEKGVVKFTPQEEGKQSVPVLLEGKTMEDFNKESNELMNLQLVNQFAPYKGYGGTTKISKIK